MKSSHKRHDSNKYPKKAKVEPPPIKEQSRSPFFKPILLAGLAIGIGSLAYWQMCGSKPSRHYAPSTAQQAPVKEVTFKSAMQELEQYAAGRKVRELIEANDRTAENLAFSALTLLTRQLRRKGDPETGLDQLLSSYVTYSLDDGKRYPVVEALPDAYQDLRTCASRLYAHLDSCGFSKTDPEAYKKAILEAQAKPLDLVSVMKGQRIVYLGEHHGSLDVNTELLARLPALRKQGFSDIAFEFPADLDLQGLRMYLQERFQNYDTIQVEYEKRALQYPDQRTGWNKIAEMFRYSGQIERTRLQLLNKAHELGMTITPLESSEFVSSTGQVSSTMINPGSPEGMAKRNAYFAERLKTILTHPNRRVLVLTGHNHVYDKGLPAIVKLRTGVEGISIQFGTEYDYRGADVISQMLNTIEYAVDCQKMLNHRLLIPMRGTPAGCDYYLHQPPIFRQEMSQNPAQKLTDSLEGAPPSSGLTPWD